MTKINHETLTRKLADDLPKEFDLNSLKKNLSELTFAIAVYSPEVDKTFYNQEYISLVNRNPKIEDGWTVQYMGFEVLAAVDGNIVGWTHERLPSGRTDDFKMATRFTLEKAYQLMLDIDYENIRKHGLIEFDNPDDEDYQ
jgi:hypothetical protein